jgi:hypothetical protein
VGVVVVVVVHRLADELGRWGREVHDDREEDVGRHELGRDYRVRVEVRVRVTLTLTSTLPLPLPLTLTFAREGPLSVAAQPVASAGWSGGWLETLNQSVITLQEA